MKLHELKPKKGSQQRPRRVGRGIAAGQGASCGFGMRGQKSRSGRSTRPNIRVVGGGCGEGTGTAFKIFLDLL